ncbi:MAG: hypothetical protein ACP5OV_06845 [Acidimicrobiales bacterium]
MAKAVSLVLALAPLASGALVAGTAGAASSHVTVTMQVITNTTGSLGGQPKFTNAAWTVKKGETVTIRIINHDDGTAPLTGSYMKYVKVMGTTTGHELVSGKVVTTVSDINVAHTFTVPGLGLNLPIPAAPTGKTNVIVATFVPKKAGTFVWHCFAPCGSGSNGMAGAMSTMTWMEGRITVAA